MQNDDLGQFPTPLTPKIPEEPKTQVSDTVPTPPDPVLKQESIPTFEPTPDEIPSSPPLKEADSEPFIPPFMPKSPIVTESQPTIATTPPSSGNSTGSLITIILLLVAGVGISGSVFLYSRSAVLKNQLTDITKTLEQQKTIITPSPTPTVIEIPTPSPTLEASDSSPLITITPTATTTPTLSKTIIPLTLAPQALKVAINHEPNAQLILIKAENAQNPTDSLIKYFFRKDLTTKKYFYVAINGKNESEIVDKSIYVNPDNNIPSLNDLVLGNKLGIDFEFAREIAEKLCDPKLCGENAIIKAQFIKSGSNTIWQLSYTTTSGNPEIIQINSTTKEILYKSGGFSK
jgi:hypothetical protein